MLEDLLPVMEKSILDSVGSIPLVFKGMERTIEKGSPEPENKSQHKYHELTYVRNGRVSFDIDGRHTVVERGGVIVIRPGRPHVTKVPDGHADMIVLYFVFSRPGDLIAVGHAEDVNGIADPAVSTDTLEGFLRFAAGDDSQDYQDDTANDAFLTLRGKSRQDIASIAERIVRESRGDRYRKNLMMQLLTVELLVALSRGLREEWEESLRKKTGKIRELVQIAKEYIAENYDRNLSVADIAGYVFLSQGYFTRVFREETDMSPMTYLMRIRIARACVLLEQQDSKISGIAAMVGFSSPQRFNAAFRKHTGMNPMAYRRSRRDMHSSQDDTAVLEE